MITFIMDDKIDSWTSWVIDCMLCVTMKIESHWQSFIELLN